MLTTLDVVNQCLASMALAPITSPEIAGHPFASTASALLTKYRLEILAKGWWCNEVLMASSVPASTLRVEGPPGRTFSLRNSTTVYDHATGAVMTSGFPAFTRAYTDLAFDTAIPEALQAYIAARTIVAFQAEYDGSDSKLKQLEGELTAALREVQGIDRVSRVHWRRLFELLAVGWWFNTKEATAPATVPAGLASNVIAVQGPPNRPLYLDPITGGICDTWTGAPIAAPVDRARLTMLVLPNSLPPLAAEWIKLAAGIDYEREALDPDARVLAELNARLEDVYHQLRRENGERMILRECSREFQARGWWFNEFGLTDASVLLDAPTVTPGADPLFPLVVGLLPGNDDVTGSTTFLDKSLYARTVTNTGTTLVARSNVLFRYGPTSIRFNSATPHRLSLAYTAATALGTGDFCIEFWTNSLTTAVQGIVSTGNSGGAGGVLIRRGFDGSRLVLTLAGTDVITSLTGTFAIGAWHFVQLQRSGSTWSLYLNENLVGTAVNASSVDANAIFLGVEASSNGGSFGNFYNGYVEQFRITRALRPTSTPTAPWPTF